MAGTQRKKAVQKRNSPSGGSAYKSRESRENNMTRIDSAQTPFFVPTPQRTGSNWGEQAYLNNDF